MKITIDKDYTMGCQLPRTKEHVKEFKAMFTDEDLLRMFRDALRNAIGDESAKFRGLYDKIIRCELSAFPGGTQEENTTHYHVEILAEGFRRFTTISFYMTHTGNVNLQAWDPFDGCMRDLYEIEQYSRVGD